MPSQLSKISGIKFEKIYSDEFRIWKLFFDNPFQQVDGRYRIGIGIKLLREAQSQGVQKFILQVGQKEITMYAPDEKDLKEKEKKNEFELKKSMFSGSPDMKIYYFYI